MKYLYFASSVEVSTYRSEQMGAILQAAFLSIPFKKIQTIQEKKSQNFPLGVNEWVLVLLIA